MLRRPEVVWGLAALFYFVALFHRMSLGVAALDAQERFGIAAATLGVFAALQLGLYLAMQIPAGLAADRIGPRRTLALGLALMCTGEMVFALAQSLPAGLVGRGLIGVGDAFIFLNVLRLAQNWFPARRYGLLSALAGVAGALGQVLTTVPLGAALDGIGWTPTFATSALVTAALVVLCLTVVRDHPAGTGGAAPVAHARIIPTLRETWRVPATQLAFWLHFVLMGTFVSVTALWGYPFLVQGEGIAPATARADLLVAVVAFGAGAPLLGLLVGRVPAHRITILAGLGALVTALWGVSLLWPGGAPHALLVATFAATGAGGGAGLLAFDIARAANPAARGGAASGLVNLGGFSSAVAAQPAVALLLALVDESLLRVAMWPLVSLGALATVMAVRHALRIAAPTATPPANRGAARPA